MLLLIKQVLTIVTIMATLLTGKVVPMLDQMQTQIGELQTTEVRMGAFNPVGGGRYYLAGSGVASSDTSIVLRSLAYPVSGYEIPMTAFGEIGYATLEPGSSSKIEFISFTGITQAAANTEATLTGVTRGLAPNSPYAASTTLQASHSGGSRVIFSNSPAYYSQFSKLKNDETITGDWTFNELPQLDSYEAPSVDEDFACKKYVDDITVAGASDAGVTTKGVVEIANIYDLANGAAASSSDTSADLVAPAKYYASTSAATSSIVITNTIGKIAQTFLDLTKNFTWIGAHTFGTTTVTTSTISTMLATTTFEGIPTLPAWDPGGANEATRKSYVDNSINSSSTNLLGASSSDFAVFNHSTNATTVLAVSVPGNTLSTSNGIYLHLPFRIEARAGCGTATATIDVLYGGSSIASTTFQIYGGWAINEWNIEGEIDTYMFASSSATVQTGRLRGEAIWVTSTTPFYNSNKWEWIVRSTGNNPSTDSSSAQQFKVDVSWDTAKTCAGLGLGFYRLATSFIEIKR